MNLGKSISTASKWLGNQIGNPTVLNKAEFQEKVKELIRENPNITDEEIIAYMNHLKENENYIFSDDPRDKIPNAFTIPRSLIG